MSPSDHYDVDEDLFGGPEITAAAPTVDPAATEEHLREVFRGCEGLVGVSWFPVPGRPPRTSAYRQADIAKVAADACGFASHGINAFIRSTTLTRAPDPARRGGAELTREFPFFHLDLDGAWGVHKADVAALPATIEDAMALLDGFPPPTRVVLSGGGLYPLWLLEDPATADDALDVLPRWGTYWKERFAKAGYHLDSTAELSRVLRVPGLLNHKGREDGLPPRPVTLMDHDAPRLTLEEIVRCLPEVEVRKSKGHALPDDWTTDPFDVLRRLGPAGHRLVAEHLMDEGRGPDRWTLAPESQNGAVDRCGWQQVGLIRPPGTLGPASSELSARIGGRHPDGRDFTGWVEVLSGSVTGVPKDSHQIGMFLAYAAFNGDRISAKAWLATRGVGIWPPPRIDPAELLDPSLREPPVDYDVEPHPDDLHAAANDLMELLTSWEPVDLRPILDGIAAGTITRPAPTIARRNDGLGLWYAARINGVFGESGAGKSFLALEGVGQELRGRQHGVWVDFEDNPDSITIRLLDLGISPDIVDNRFHYLGPQVAFNDVTGSPLLELIERVHPTIVVIDSTGEAMAVQGTKDKDDEVAAWFRIFPRRLARMGCAVVVIDHVTKDHEGRGLYAIGSQRKRAAIDGAVFSVDAVHPFGIGQLGVARITCAKDRNGVHPNGRPSGTFTLDARVARHYKASIEAPSDSGETEKVFRPTFLMEKISRALEALPGGSGLSKNAIEEAVKGNAGAKRLALEMLVAEGFVIAERRGQAHLHRSEKRFRADLDAAERAKAEAENE